MRELVRQLKDERGRLREFRAFREAALTINKQYNQQWLRAEYNAAVRAVRAAVQWQQHRETKERYQNLKYVAIQDERTQQSHRVWDGTVLPIGHQFWEVHYPPNGWNCRCHVVSTDEPINGTGLKAEQRPARPFAINYGKQGKVFGDGHPHFKVDGKVAEAAKAALIAYQQREVRTWARKHLVGTALQKEGVEVLFTEEGVERALRQEHPEKYFQLLALRDIKRLLGKAERYGGGSGEKGWKHYEVDVNGMPSVISMRKSREGKHHFYTLGKSKYQKL